MDVSDVQEVGRLKLSRVLDLNKKLDLKVIHAIQQQILFPLSLKYIQNLTTTERFYHHSSIQATINFHLKFYNNILNYTSASILALLLIYVNHPLHMAPSIRPK